MFADIAGSTSLGERLAPHLVRLVIGDCVSDLTGIVERFEGCVTAHMGDGIAAFFGLHGAHEDDPQRAAFAALEMIKAVEAFGREVAAAWDADDFAIRIGVNAGRVATARIGASDPAKHALGDPVNVAARLQALAPRNGVLVGGEAVVQLDERFDLEQLPPVVVKGRRHQVSAWKLRGFDPSAKRDLSKAPLIGREVECRTLESVGADVLAGRGRILLFTGEAGIGKSRLLAEFEDMVCPGALWLEASCAGQGVGTPFRPIADLVRHWLGIDDEVPSVAIRVGLQHALERSGLIDAEDVLAGFEWLLGARGPEPDVVPWDEQRSPEAIQTEMRESIMKWLDHLAAERPVVVVLEDAEKMDASTRSMIEDVMDLTDGGGLSLAIALRPDSYSEGWMLRVRTLAEYAHRGCEISVLPLTSSATSELVGVLDHQNNLAEQARERVVRTAEGNPLFAEELYRSFIDEEGKSRLTNDSEELPVALEGLLLARIDRLDVETRTIAQCAAAVGRVFSIEVVEHALGMYSIEGNLRELCRTGLVVEYGRYPEVRYAFRHGLFKDATLSTLLPEHRRDLHCRIAGALRCCRDGSEDLEELGNHFAMGEMWGQASTCFMEAADHALQVDATEGALKMLEQGWEACLKSGNEDLCVDIGEKLAGLLIDLGRTEDACRVYDRTCESVGGGLKPRMYSAVVECLADEGRCYRAREVLKAAYEGREVALVDPHLCYASAHLAFRENRYDDVLVSLKEIEVQLAALEAACRLRHKVAWIWGGYSAAIGDFVGAELWTQERRKVAEEAGDTVSVLEAEGDRAIVLLCRGRVSESERMLERVLGEARRLGYQKQACGAALNLLHVYWLSGNLRRGKCLKKEIECWDNVPVWGPQILGGMAWIALLSGEGSEAKELYERVLAERGAWEDELVVAGCRVGLALEMVAAGRVEEGESELRAVVGDLSGVNGRLEQRSWARVALGEIAVGRGDGDAGEREGLMALEDAERAERPARVAPMRVLGMAQEVREAGSGRPNLEAALRLAREMGMRLEEGRTVMALARFGFGDRERLLAEAKEIFEECGAQPDLEALRELEQAAGAGAV